MFTDDIDGGKAREMVAFGLDGVNYEIALHNKKTAALRKSLAEVVARRDKSGMATPFDAASSATRPQRTRRCCRCPTIGPGTSRWSCDPVSRRGVRRTVAGGDNAGLTRDLLPSLGNGCAEGGLMVRITHARGAVLAAALVALALKVLLAVRS